MREIFTTPRKLIFKEIHNNSKIKFNELKQNLNLESNDLSYHLSILKKNNLITNNNTFYELTNNGKTLYPYLPILTEEQKPIFVVCCAALIKNDTIYFQKKPREPEKGSLIMFGGKVLEHTTIEQTLINYIKEQAKTTPINLKLRCVNEFIKEDFHNIVYFYTAEPETEPKENLIKRNITELKDEELFWDNKFFLKEMLNNEEPKVTQINLTF